jgi:hypothetical protein
MPPSLYSLSIIFACLTGRWHQTLASVSSQIPHRCYKGFLLGDILGMTVVFLDTVFLNLEVCKLYGKNQEMTAACYPRHLQVWAMEVEEGESSLLYYDACISHFQLCAGFLPPSSTYHRVISELPVLSEL